MYHQRYKNSLLHIVSRLTSSYLAKRIISGAFWSVFGTAVGKLFVLAAGIACANILGKVGYGQLGIVRSTINLFVVFGMAGMGVTASKFIAQYKNTDKEYAGKIASITQLFAVFAGFIACLIVLVFADSLASSALNAPQLAPEIRIGAILLFVTILNGAQNGILSGFEKFRAIAQNTFIASACEGGLMVLGAWVDGVFGAVLGFGIGYGILYICNKFSINSACKETEIRQQWRGIKWSDLRILYRFSLPAALSSLLVMPAYWIVRTMIIRYNGFGELGIYEAADQWRMIILFIPGALSQIVLPILSNVLEENGSQSFWKVIWSNIAINVAITAILSLIVMLCGEWLMQLNGKDFIGSATITCLAFSTVFSSAATVVGNAITSRGKVWIGFTFNFVWACMFVGFSLYALNIGLASMGVAAALLAAYVLHTTFQLVYLIRIK